MQLAFALFMIAAIGAANSSVHKVKFLPAKIVHVFEHNKTQDVKCPGVAILVPCESTK